MTTTEAPKDSRATSLIAFWKNAGFKAWFTKDAAFDEAFRSQFIDLHVLAAEGKLSDWAMTPDGALALLLLLDQFPRNAFRGTPRMFATDPLALVVAKAAIDAGHDKKVDAELRLFFYLPLEHAENAEDQDRCVALHEEMGNPELTKYAVVHRDVIARFGRFPHRNALVGRQTTAEEQAFLDEGGFSG